MIRAGRAPQEVAFSGARALLTSGYGSSIQAVLWRTYRRLGRVPMPYGSFNLVTIGGKVVTSSLFTGQITVPAGEGLRRGFCHQEAAQAHGEEEAPQAVEEDARPASQARQVVSTRVR